MAAKKKATAKKTTESWESSIADLCSAINAKYKKSEDVEVMAVTGDSPAISDIKGFISTGNFPLDVSTVIGHGIRGGVPMGRVVEIFGHESVGKSALLSSIFASAQKGRGCLVSFSEDNQLFEVKQVGLPEGLAVLIDSESGFNKLRAEQIECDTKKLIILDGVDTIEDGFSALHAFIDAYESKEQFRGRPVAIGWDTLTAAPTEAEYEGRGEAIAARAVIIRKELKRIIRRIGKHPIAFVLINQSMAEIGGGGGFGSPKIEASGTGRGPRFYATIRWRINRIGFWTKTVDKKKKKIGIEAEVLVVKNKIGPPQDRIPLPISFTASGIDDRQAMFMFCTNAEFWPDKPPIRKSGGYYSVVLPDGSLSEKFYEKDWFKFLHENKDVRQHLKNLILSNYGSGLMI